MPRSRGDALHAPKSHGTIEKKQEKKKRKKTRNFRGIASEQRMESVLSDAKLGLEN